MSFSQVQELPISKKKVPFIIHKSLQEYLVRYSRHFDLKVTYNDLCRFSSPIPIHDKNGVDTLWESVSYDNSEVDEILDNLKWVYTSLKSMGDITLYSNVSIDRIDHCTFGNSNPFRVKVTNKYNDNYEYFYVKKADASRIYGLEIEAILSPNRIMFLTNSKDTIIEEHIAGVPGDDYIKKYLSRKKKYKNDRLAKEFVKFNERCFIRLLGDMRSCNFVVISTQDFEDTQYRIRSFDFDQQSYEGKMKLYMPQFLVENNKFVKLVSDNIDPVTIKQYQYEERTLIFRRIIHTKYKLKSLIDSMREVALSQTEKILQLKNELADYHKNKKFLKCKTMGDLVRYNFHSLIRKVKPD